jgi:hypothetical protein
VVRLPGEAGDRPGSILDGVRARIGIDGLIGIQPVESGEGWRTTLAFVEAECIEVAPAGYAWAPAAAVLAATQPGPVRAALERSLAALADAGSDAFAPWFMPGWRARTTAWMADRLAERGRSMTEEPRVIHSGPVSVVLRADTTEGPVFHKASVRLFAQEATILVALGRRTPGWVPDVLAVDPAVGALMAPLAGRELGDDPSETWGRGLRRLAELQIAWAGHIDELLAAGAQARSLRALAARVEGMDEVFDALVRLEPDAWPAWPDLAAGLIARIQGLGASPIASTLVHGDLHPGNVHVDGDEVLVFDWSDTAITHPFVDLAVFLHDLPTPAGRRDMIDAYLEPWSLGYERAALERAAHDALVVGAVYQAATYLDLVPALDPRDRWQYRNAAPRWLRSAIRPLEVAPGLADGAPGGPGAAPHAADQTPEGRTPAGGPCSCLPEPPPDWQTCAVCGMSQRPGKPSCGFCGHRLAAGHADAPTAGA